MGMINNIEQALITRLQDDLGATGPDQITRSMAGPAGTPVTVPVPIKSYPSKPNDLTLKTLASSGAVLVRYSGSKYGSPRYPEGLMVQDRVMLFEVHTVSETLLPEAASSGIYDILDLAALRLIGHKPAGSCGCIELVQDDYVMEKGGAWEYGLIVSVPVQITVSI
jgi:hypothetical protein